MEVSPSLTVAHITEDRIGPNICQVPLSRCEMILVSFRRPKEGSCGGINRQLRAYVQVSGHDPVVAACCLRSLIVVGALRHDEFVSDEDVIETVLGWIRLTAADVRDCQRPMRPSLLDLLVLSMMYSEVIEEGVTQFMDFVAAEEQVL
jgi:hypothetical protein